MGGVGSGRRGHRTKPILCACGERKARYSMRCKACAMAATAATVARRRPAFTCEWCQHEFWRPRKGNDKHDRRRFCSKRCSALLRTTARRMPWQNPDVQLRLALEREHRREQQRQRQQWLKQQRQQEQQEQTKCACGSPSTQARWTYEHPYMRRWCDACYAQEFYAWQHCCPNCGQEFYGEYRNVYCSMRCAKQMRHRHERSDTYPLIGALPLAERNKLAQMIALMRAANRRMRMSPA